MQRLMNSNQKSRPGQEVSAGSGPLPANRKERYSNLLFLAFNAVFLVALFWMLPALGTGFPKPHVQANVPALQLNVTGSRASINRTVYPGRIDPLLQYTKLDFRPLGSLMPVSH